MYDIGLSELELLQHSEYIKNSIDNILKTQNCFNQYDIILYGSSSHKLFIKNYSDFNFCIRCQHLSVSHDKAIEYITRSLSKMANKFDKIKIVHSLKRLKSIHVFDKQSNYQIGIVLNESINIASSRFIGSYQAMDARFSILCCIIKYWAKQRNIALSTYPLILMVIQFLQIKNILPTLSVLIFDKATNLSMWSHDDYQINLQFYRDFASNNKESYIILLLDFFHFYGFIFDYQVSVISVRNGLCLTTSGKQWITNPKQCFHRNTLLIYGYVGHQNIIHTLIPIDILSLLLLFYHQNCKYCLYIEDPFDSKINVAANVNEQDLDNMLNEFERAYRILSKSDNINKVCELNTCI